MSLGFPGYKTPMTQLGSFMAIHPAFARCSPRAQGSCHRSWANCVACPRIGFPVSIQMQSSRDGQDLKDLKLLPWIRPIKILPRYYSYNRTLYSPFKCWLGYCQFVMRIQHNNSPHLMVTQTARVREQICAIALHDLIQICIITEWIFLFWTKDLLFSCLCQN